MCGIAGTYHLGRGAPPVDERIRAALACIAHRGPDDEGVHRAGRAVLGHRRLSIIDTSPAGHQPFTDLDGRYTMVFNGEVFNFAELVPLERLRRGRRDARRRSHMLRHCDRSGFPRGG